MKKTITFLLALLMGFSIFAAEKKLQLNWEPTFSAAKEKSLSQKKPIFIFFTGSDWCSWCKRIDAEIFSHGKFIRYANKNFILYKADFPRANRPVLSIRQVNTYLAKKFEIEGFPTIIITDANEMRLGTLGYVRGGPDSFIQQLSKYVK